MSYIPTDEGRWVDENFERLARIVQDYDPQFELRWIPPEHRETPTEKSKPYVIVDIFTNTAVLYASELETPADILTRLFDSDNKHGNVLERIDKHNAAVQAIKMKEQLDRREEQMEKVAWLAGTKKNFINMGNGRVVDDQLRTVRRGKR